MGEISLSNEFSSPVNWVQLEINKIVNKEIQISKLTKMVLIIVQSKSFFSRGIE